MKDGLSNTIEYIWLDGVPRFAEFRNTDVHLEGTPFQNTTDPNWFVHHRDDANQGEFEWLNYLTLDKRPWSAKLHCAFQAANEEFHVPEYISPWFEHKPFPDGPEHTESFMCFLDWDYQPWKAQLLAVDRPFPAQPQFILSRL